MSDAKDEAAVENTSERAWAPCAHTDAEREQAGEWLRGVLGHTEDAGDPELVTNSERSALEHLLWLIALGDDRGWPFTTLRFGFFADQWVGVVAAYALPDGARASLWTEGATFSLALAKTVERLREKAAAYAAAHQEPRPANDDGVAP